MSVRPRCYTLSWGKAEAEEFAVKFGNFDLLLGADVVFWPDTVPLLIETVHCFLSRQVCDLFCVFLFVYIVCELPRFQQ